MPDSEGNLSTEDLGIIFKFFEEKEIFCSTCKSQFAGLAGETWNLRTSPKFGYACAVLFCTNCGHVEFFLLDTILKNPEEEIPDASQ